MRTNRFRGVLVSPVGVLMGVQIGLAGVHIGFEGVQIGLSMRVTVTHFCIDFSCVGVQ